MVSVAIDMVAMECCYKGTVIVENDISRVWFVKMIRYNNIIYEL